MIERLNAEVADRLDDVVTLLAGQRANRFRIQAYRRVAAQIRRLPLPIAETLERVCARSQRLATALPSPFAISFDTVAWACSTACAEKATLPRDIAVRVPLHRVHTVNKDDRIFWRRAEPVCWSTARRGNRLTRREGGRDPYRRCATSKRARRP